MIMTSLQAHSFWVLAYLLLHHRLCRQCDELSPEGLGSWRMSWVSDAIEEAGQRRFISPRGNMYVLGSRMRSAALGGK